MPSSSSRKRSGHRASRLSKQYSFRRPFYPGRVLRTPLTFPRPVLEEVNSSYIESAYPELTGIPARYIRERLPLKATRMLAALGAVNAQPPTNTLPEEMEIATNRIVAADRPTHMLAVHSSESPKVTVFPVHQLVLAVNCSKLPPLPPLSSGSPNARTSILPVVPLCLPSPETFPLLQSYLYTKRANSLLSALLPPATFNSQILARHALVLNGLWQNACALGIVDQNLWDTIDFAWVVMLLQASASQ